MNQNDSTDCCLRPMTKNDLSLVLQWRNHPSVRKYMFNQNEINEEEHKLWFKNTSVDKGRYLFIFEKTGEPQGFMNFHKLFGGDVIDWGFYLSPNAEKGTGNMLGKTALAYAFENLNLHKVCGQAIAYNEKSKRFHLRLGFKEEGELKEQYYDGENYHSIILFGLLKDEWQKN